MVLPRASARNRVETCKRFDLASVYVGILQETVLSVLTRANSDKEDAVYAATVAIASMP